MKRLTNLKQPQPARGKSGAGSFAEIYNLEPGECRWPVFPRFIAQQCDFKIRDNIKDTQFDIVVLPAGTDLFHATTIYGNIIWYKQDYPQNRQYGGVWFTPSQKHALNFTKATHVLRYTLTKDVNLVFIQNIVKKFNVGSGYDFVGGAYRIIKDYILNQHKTIQIDGYIGCNECECFLENAVISQALSFPPTVAFERELKYTD